MARNLDSKSFPLDATQILGVPILDRQHRSILALLKQLECTPEALITSEGINELMTRLMSQLPEHFDTEEEWMKSSGMPSQLIAEHSVEHTRVIEDLTHLQTEAMKKNTVKVGAVVKIIREWILHHIYGLDLEIKKYVKP